MKYLGGKSKIAKRLAAAILSHAPAPHQRLIEPFMGGGAMTAELAPHFAEVEASDVCLDLVLMWKELQRGWVPPSVVSEEQYAGFRHAEASPMRGFVGYSCSWGAKWFGGYARGDGPHGTKRNYAAESVRSLMRDVPRFKTAAIVAQDYQQAVPRRGDVVYADPPYAQTTGYGVAFDHVLFWATMDKWVSRGATVFVSEYRAPQHWRSVWEVTRTRDLKSKFTNAVSVTERLFMSKAQIPSEVGR